MRDHFPGLSVTLSTELYAHLSSESRRLGVALEWLVASMIVDTRCATTTTQASRVTGRSAARNRASVDRSRAENESSNR